MSSVNIPKSTCKHPCDKCLSPGTTNALLDESDLSVRPADINITGNPYVNTPSPSSIASTSTIDRSSKSRSKSDYSHMTSKRRHRHDKPFHYTHSLNRQYIITMTNILFQMQKEIFKLKRRTQHVEQMLVNQTQSGQPIIRIPRLTKDEITTICINENEIQQNNASTISKENNNNNDHSSSMVTNNLEISTEHKNNTESSIITQPSTNQTNNPESTLRTKYCLACNHEFSHRSAYLRHIRRIHHGIYPTKESTNNDNNNSIEADSSYNETPVLTITKSENDIIDDSYQVLVNQWDIGEGRLRPRPASKSNIEPLNKIKCDICNKFFRAEYIMKHKRRTHRIRKSSISSESNNISDQTIETTVKPMDDIQTVVGESPTTSTNPPSTITIAEMDVDDIPIRFRKESNKPIVISSTCLERYQIELLEEFIQKFASRVCQSSAVDSRTTHLITNDDQHLLRSPLSMKLIEGIANHCYCLSYRWLIDCLKYDRIVDETTYEIEGDNTDHSTHGGPKRSRSIEKRHALFDKICFMIKCTENNDIRMTNDRLQDLITTCGGQIITCVTQDLLDRNTIVVLCDRLYVSERRHNYDQCRELGIHFVSSDWVLESILEYRQKSFLAYEETPL